MITVVIPTSNSEVALAYTLASLVGAAADGVVREVVVVDAGSRDGTLRVADESGCNILERNGDLAGRLRAGAAEGRRGSWLMFVRPGAVLSSGWHGEAATFAERAERSGRGVEMAAVFRFALDEMGLAARVAEARVSLAARVLRMPAAEQALLLPRALYDKLGGHRDLPRYEEIDLVRRVGRGRLHVLHSEARVASRADLVRARGRLGGALLALRVSPEILSRIGA